MSLRIFISFLLGIGATLFVQYIYFHSQKKNREIVSPIPQENPSEWRADVNFETLTKIRSYSNFQCHVNSHTTKEIWQEGATIEGIYRFLTERDYDNPLFDAYLWGGQTQQGLITELANDIHHNAYPLSEKRKEEILSLFIRLREFEERHPNRWYTQIPLIDENISLLSGSGTTYTPTLLESKE